MIDQETKSLWSHILGEAMSGQLKGTQLEIIPAEMVTWESWLSQYPESKVLNLKRTDSAYTADFYANPDRFVFGWVSVPNSYSVAFDVLLEHPILNLEIDGWHVLVTYDTKSTAAHLFSREVDGEELYFTLSGENLMRDEQTGSIWNRNTGLAMEGSLKGKSLEHQAAIVSYAGAWEFFHPDNIVITHVDDVKFNQ
jgi:hypothetical protein